MTRHRWINRQGQTIDATAENGIIEIAVDVFSYLLERHGYQEVTALPDGLCGKQDSRGERCVFTPHAGPCSWGTQ